MCPFSRSLCRRCVIAVTPSCPWTPWSTAVNSNSAPSAWIRSQLLRPQHLGQAKYITKTPYKFVMWRNIRFLHICHAEKFEIFSHVEKSQISPQKFEISPHDKFFLHVYIRGICDKYEVCKRGNGRNVNHLVRQKKRQCNGEGWVQSR